MILWLKLLAYMFGSGKSPSELRYAIDNFEAEVACHEHYGLKSKCIICSTKP